MSTNIYNFNSGWVFSKLPADNVFCNMPVQEIHFDDSAWESIALPHTYNDKDGASGRTGICEGGENYYRGITCYRKRFDADFGGKRVFIEFGAANNVAEVYVNEAFIGRHEGGYSAFRFDITDYVKPTDNLIAVKVNNAPTDYIAPITDQGDFTKMGGLYRDVKLIVTEKAHIDMLDYGSSGIYVTPKNITAEKADIDIVVKLANDDTAANNLTVRAEIFDMDNNSVAVSEKNVLISSDSRYSLKINTSIAKPVFWNGRENPYLYNAEITIYDGDDVLDEITQNFGIRTYFIDAEKGFFLNGKHLDMRGANYHQDSFESGWAMTDEQRERDYKMMLDMGCTSVRMAHYQHCQNEYDLCDRYGLTVWSEIGIVNKMSPDNESLAIADGFAENAKQQLIELIRQNYNHPSIIVWGISNELHQMSDEIYDLYRELHSVAENEDSTRLKTFADAQFWGRFLELPGDVVGYNRYFGWYKEAGPAEKFGEWLDLYHNEKETRPICVSEYGGGGAISQHKDNIDWENEIDPWGERHYENYQSAMHEKIWAQFAQRQYLWGKYVWCMFDFASDGREEGDTKGQNDKGLCTRERIPKDAFYFYKSVWNSEPMVHITEKRFTERPSFVPQVKAYSNGSSAELFVNGVSVGTAKAEKEFPTVFVWKDVKLNTEKENAVTVRAYFADGTCLEDNAVWFGTSEV
ncbi:MAG: DUF4982 domain-containing protein [Oscillospiraceae bacterium]|nr:DUF4982 domain-containing protein [Oscillospiraceae bacterium]